MVPILQCGLFRSNFALAMFLQPALFQWAKRDITPNIGAGEGNRTLVISLEGFCSTIELHPQFPRLSLHSYAAVPCRRWWGRLDSNQRRRSQGIYSPPPLPLGTLPHDLLQ